MPAPQTPPRLPSFGDALESWALVAAQSFGGPSGQIAAMHRVWVVERRWLSEDLFLRSLNTAMLLPGPAAHQLAAHVGWLTHGVRGGMIAGALFVLPGFVAICTMSAVLARIDHLPAAAAAIAGLNAVVVAVVADAAIRIGRRVLTAPPTALVAAAAFAGSILGAPVAAVFVAAGLAGMIRSSWFPPPDPPTPRDRTGRPAIDALLRTGALPHTAPAPRRDAALAVALTAAWLAPLAAAWALLGADAAPTVVAGTCAKAALAAFGGAYGALAYVAQHLPALGAAPADLATALGLAEAAPGPAIGAMQHLGFVAMATDPGPLDPLVAGIAGAAFAGWATYGPGFVFAVAAGPYATAIRDRPALHSAIRAITAAVVGTLGGLALSLALSAAGAEDGSIRWGIAGIVGASAFALTLLRLPVGVVLAAGAVGNVALWGVFG